MANPSRLEKIQITENSNSGTAIKVNVQESNGEVNTQSINTAFNKNFGLNAGDVVGATTLLNQYSTVPADWTETTFDSGQVVFYGGKQWIAKIATVAGDVPSVSSKWEEITFEALSNKTVIVDATPTDGSINAVSSNGVFDALATKAHISSVHDPVTLGTANGLSLSNQQLSLGLASSSTTGALSGTDWNTFNGKFNTPTGLITNYLPKWNGSGFGDSIASEVGGEFKVNGSGLFTSGIKMNYGSTIDAIGFANTKILSTGYQSGTNDYVAFFTPGSGGGGEVMRYLTNQTLLIGYDLENGSGSKLQVAGTISASPATTANQVVVKSQLDAFVPSGTVNLTGAQTVLGVKTFSSSPIVPNAVNANEAANKGQLDSKASLSGATFTGDVTIPIAILDKLYLKSSPSNPDLSAIIAISKNINAVTSHIIEDSSTITPPSGADGYGIVDMVTTVNGSNPATHVHAYQSRITYTSSANMPTNNFSSITSFYSENRISGTGVVDKVIGLKVVDTYMAQANKINKQYGILIENQTVGAINYGIWNDTRGNYMKGLSIGTDTIDLSNALNVNGTISASPAVNSNQVVVKSQLDALAISGVYAASISNAINISGITIGRANYMKIGNVVSVNFSGSATFISTNASVTFEISLPFNKTLTNNGFTAGSAIPVSGGIISTGIIQHINSVSTFRVSINSSTLNGLGTISGSFMYNITD